MDGPRWARAAPIEGKLGQQAWNYRISFESFHPTSLIFSLLHSHRANKSLALNLRRDKAMTEATIVRPPFRELQVFAFDPSLQSEMERRTIQSVKVKIVWEDWPEDIPPESRTRKNPDGPAPGPIGEYLEVIDYDPASKQFYKPVDINSPYLLSQNGLAPSVGNPQFHQQMVYAVSMKTIGVFERALGRPVFWSPRQTDENGNYIHRFVRRLRIYPHAFQDANAFYSPSKKALLFGYFNAINDPTGHHLPGGIVFTCLSHDIIVHELSHALLDGLHRRFIIDSNPDVLAFHEAFADIMALFQHFTYPDVVRHELAKSRGRLEDRHILGDLAKEMGKAIGRSKALRSFIGEKPDPTRLKRTLQPHSRGAILVAAIFDAFLFIYNNRTADLFRIASSGTGILEPGALSPDLVNRLSIEASKSANHVLTICIRALDYLPPVDITFGDYLRALITADKDMVEDDKYGYRTAFIEAFKQHGIYPKSVKNLSEESLCWEKPDPGQEGSFTFVKSLSNEIKGWEASKNREKLWRKINIDQARSHAIFKKSWNYKGRFINGLEINSPEDIFEIHSIRPMHRIGPGGNLRTDMLVEITQKRPGFFDKSMGGLTEKDRAAEPDFWFRGGCTILVDLHTAKLRYCIYKDIASKTRYERQQEHEKSKWEAFAERAMYLQRYDASNESQLFSWLHQEIDTFDTDGEDSEYDE